MAFIGPPLPPGMNKAQDKEEEDVIGAQSSCIGPQLPPAGQSRQLEEADPDSQGPSLQPDNNYGPALPPGFKVQTCDDEEAVESRCGRVGPTLPPGVGVADSEEEDNVIGPMPVVGGVSEAYDSVRRSEFESRAKAMKNKLLGKDVSSAPKREEWMTELPPEIKPSGIGARKFRTNAVELGDRSVWTDTPADRLRKEQEACAGPGRTKRQEEREKKESTDHIIAERDRELATLVEEYNTKHRSKSLMEMHSRKRKAESEGKGQAERRPFDRERDLEVSRLITPAKRKALMKDSTTALSSKFTHGSRSFL